MFRKILLWAFCLLLLISGSARASAMVSVAAGGASLRSGPGDKHPVTWNLGAGFPLRAVEELGEWYRVEDFDGDSGWLRKEQAVREPHVIVKAERAEVRSGPSDRYRVVGKASRGVVFKVLKVKEKWIKVRHADGLTGWVSRALTWGA
jgi:SH3-like domain-containing protein